MGNPIITLTSTGTYGDILPLLAVGQALKARGAGVRFGVQADHVPLIQAAGFEAKAILPGMQALCDGLGISVADLVGPIMNDPDFLFEKIWIPHLSDTVDAVHALAQGCDVIVGTFQTAAGPLVAERLGVPYVPLFLQPLALMAANDPPVGAGLWMFRTAPGPIGLRWNGVMRRALLAYFSRRFGAAFNTERKRMGLGPASAAPYFGYEPFIERGLCLYPTSLHRSMPEHPLDLDFSGFCFGQAPDQSPDADHAKLTAFLAGGAPPIVFTLGSIADQVRGGFYEIAQEAARAVGKRAVLLTGADWDGQVLGDDIFAAPYLNHRDVFAGACAVVHHGGVGTWAEALRAGHPQVVVPFGTDQPDTAARVRHMGVGTSVPAKGLSAALLTAALQNVLSDPKVTDAAQVQANALETRDGAARAADILLARAQDG